MRLLVHDPAYTERLAAFLRSVGKQPVVTEPDTLDVPDAERVELEVYVRVWQVLYPDAAVELLP